MRIEFGTLHPQLGDRMLEFVDGSRDILHRQRGKARETRGILTRGGGDFFIHIARQRLTLLGIEVVTKKRRVNRQHLHIHALRVHVFHAFFGRVAHLGRVEVGALAVADDGAEARAGFVTIAMPFLFGVGGVPQRAWDYMGVYVDGFHESIFILRDCVSE